MDVRLTAEQQQLRDAAAKLADDLGPGAVQDLDDERRIARLDKQIEATGWRSLRSDGASGVEVAIVAEEFGRRLVDTPFLGPVLADDLARHLSDVRTADAQGAPWPSTIARSTPGAVGARCCCPEARCWRRTWRRARRRGFDQGGSGHGGIVRTPR